MGADISATRSAREVIELYNYELWNQQRYDLADELVADEWVRHDVGSVRTITRAEAKQRVVDTWAGVDRLHFDLLHVICEGELCTIVYECHITPKGGGDTSVISSIEVYRVVDGRICEAWNASHIPGSWQ
jgi:predicted SnoaL-like aldol condensation-catalyzing enzyme